MQHGYQIHEQNIECFIYEKDLIVMDILYMKMKFYQGQQMSIQRQKQESIQGLYKQGL